MIFRRRLFSRPAVNDTACMNSVYHRDIHSDASRKRCIALAGGSVLDDGA